MNTRFTACCRPLIVVGAFALLSACAEVNSAADTGAASEVVEPEVRTSVDVTDALVGTSGGDAGAPDLQRGGDAARHPDVVEAEVHARGGPHPVWLAGASTEGTEWLEWDDEEPTVPEIFGPQGGYHIWVSVCVPATFGDAAEVELRLTDKAAGVATPPGKVVLNTALKPAGFADGRLCRVGIPAFLSCACQADGRPLTVRAQVRSLGGDTPWSWSERTVTPVHIQGPCVGQSSLVCQAWAKQLGS